MVRGERQPLLGLPGWGRGQEPGLLQELSPRCCFGGRFPSVPGFAGASGDGERWGSSSLCFWQSGLSFPIWSLGNGGPQTVSAHTHHFTGVL